MSQITSRKGFRMLIFIIIVFAIAAVFGIRANRLRFVTKPVFNYFKKALPPLSETERQAMEAGDIWWDGELFSGRPNWHTFRSYPSPQLSHEEQAFIDNQVTTLLDMLDDHQIVTDRDLPKAVWQYLKEEGFFALIVPKSHGGHGFSAYANSTIVSKIACSSLSAAVTVMVPNSLGPAELLAHYGTQEQQDFWLPKLANGDEVPCFALTALDAGSDAGAIQDYGVVCKKRYKNKMTIGIKLNWQKRYITLAPIATVIGLAFKLYDPDGLLGDKEDLGICCALIPAKTKGVTSGKRHDPMGMAFMNGPTTGEDVFVPLDALIGGEDFIGKGWRMLVECLSAGRGISLPALATATAHLTTRTTSAYALIRKQFGLPIAHFEGVAESLAHIAAMSYLTESARRMTTTALDLNLSPAVITAITKYHLTELGRDIINRGFDIQAGKAVQNGPSNSLASAYKGTPVSITVEGANILTRCLMIFGQGATRCHPFILKEMEAVALEDEQAGLNQFDDYLCKHIVHTMGNFGFSFFHSLTCHWFVPKVSAGPVAHYYQTLTKFSASFAFCSDYAMLLLGGSLKRKEATSARLGDILSQLYLASSVLKRYEDDGRQISDLPFVTYSIDHCLYQIGQAFEAFFANITLGKLLRITVFPWGNPYRKPNDENFNQVVKSVTTNTVMRERLCNLCHVKPDSDISNMERLLVLLVEQKGLISRFEKTMKQARFDIKYDRIGAISDLDDDFSEAEKAKLTEYETLRQAVINVDEFEQL